MSACMLSHQSCSTQWDPINCSLPGFSVHETLQARTLEWPPHWCIWLHLSLECFRAGWPWEGGITFVEKVAETHRARQGRNGQLLGAKKPWARKSPIKASRCLEPNCLNNKRVLGCCAGDGTLGRWLTSWIGVVLYGVYRTLSLGFYSFVSL